MTSSSGWRRGGESEGRTLAEGDVNKISKQVAGTATVS